MCYFTKVSCATIEPVIENIINSSKEVLEEEGLINFRVGKIISRANCSSKTFYRVYENKSDLLLCLWIKNSISNYLVELDQTKTKLSAIELMLLPIVFTQQIHNSETVASRAISASLNSSVWSLVESTKSTKVKARVNFFWSWVRHYALKSYHANEIQGDIKDVYLMCDKISYLLRGFIMVNNTKLVSENNRTDETSTFLDMISSEMITLGIKEEVVHKSFDKCLKIISELLLDKKEISSCKHCKILDKLIEKYSFDEFQTT